MRKSSALKKPAPARGVSLEIEAREPKNLKRSQRLRNHIGTTTPKAFRNGKTSNGKTNGKSKQQALPVFGSLSILFCSVCGHFLASHVSPRGRLMDCAYANGRDGHASK